MKLSCFFVFLLTNNANGSRIIKKGKLIMAIYMRFPNGLKKVFTMSYDDGVRQDRRLIEILDRYGIKATFNINSGIFEAAADYERQDGTGPNV